LDLGGKRASSTISSFTDSFGYVIASLSGYLTAVISENFKWNGVFVLLSLVTVFLFILCVLFTIFEICKFKIFDKKMKKNLN
jgi:sugar phosphate permease